ncbi:MAG: TIGR00730 family Rossman fold protein [Burkholderiales bacterium]|nr:MAG: TIGR00730 family Rossman fold protein [Betaproteobacteria bacterium]TAG24679.1 MAG: TIGR00730 family Rossman fold protein [Burkholderiales bacterium]
MSEPKPLRRVVVYCGANAGNNPAFAQAARDVGAELARRKIGLVYGGGGVGLMGIVADAALAAGGEVIGVIPEALKALEVSHSKLTELHVVPDMHSRKAMMLALSDAVIAMPGGFGTLDELFEALTWSQLDYHRMLCGLLNVAGYYDHLIAWIEHSVATGLLKRENESLIVHGSDIGEMLDTLGSRPFPLTRKWMGR